MYHVEVKRFALRNQGRFDNYHLRSNRQPGEVMRKFMPVFVLLLLCLPVCAAETNDVATRLHSLEEGFGQLDAKLSRQMNELLWRQRLEDIAVVEKVLFTGPPPRGINAVAPSA